MPGGQSRLFSMKTSAMHRKSTSGEALLNNGSPTPSFRSLPSSECPSPSGPSKITNSGPLSPSLEETYGGNCKSPEPVLDRTKSAIPPTRPSTSPFAASSSDSPNSLRSLIRKHSKEGSFHNKGKSRKAVLIGKTGSGKSTIANMLYKGNLDEPLLTPIGSGLRGTTTGCLTLEGKEWTVVDTIGFGEPDTGRIPDTEAQAKVVTFLRHLKGSYSHLIFVKEATRQDLLDQILWNVFKELFKGAEKNFVVLLTKPDNSNPEGWVEENFDALRTEFSGLNPEHFFCVDFLPVDEDEDTENDYRVYREQQRQRLVKYLDSLNLHMVEPDIARMGDAQLAEKAEYLLKYIMDLVRRIMDKPVMRLVTLGVVIVVNVIGLVTSL